MKTHKQQLIDAKSACAGSRHSVLEEDSSLYQWMRAHDAEWFNKYAALLRQHLFIANPGPSVDRTAMLPGDKQDCLRLTNGYRNSSELTVEEIKENFLEPSWS
nr:hypothetical protein [uncultured Albidiferax sp.]